MNVSFTVWLKDSGSFVNSHPEWKTERLALVIWTRSALVEHARYVLYWFPVLEEIRGLVNIKGDRGSVHTTSKKIENAAFFPTVTVYMIR